MSSLEKMAIQGVRSFGPDDEHKQIIEFFSPLTLILGPNGTGKTTIIECLKYMTTGDLPPGGKTNAAFIHDPKIAGETEVKAKIQLLLQDVQSKRCNVIRSLLATQKAKKTELKTLEGLIQRKDKSGVNRAVSSKCAEMDREMVSLLGVAKPVLDSVIFCHQEESNWPLSEGKALKTRFDDIFASTRYVKALEVIRKFRTEQSTEIRVFHKDIQYLKQNKDKAAELKADLAEQETKYLASKEMVAEIKGKMEPVLEKLNRLRARSQDVFKLQTRIEKMQTERTQIERSQKELQRNIKNNFQGSTAELEKVLNDFSGDLEQKEAELQELEVTEDKFKRKLYQVSDEKNDLLMQQGMLQQEAERHKKNIKNRDKMIEKLADEYSVTGYTAPLSERQINQFLKVLHEKEQDLEEELKRKRAIREEDELKVQEEIDDLRNTKTKLETELQMKLETLNKNRKEIREINDKLSRVDASAGKLADIQRDLKKTERELEETQRGVDVDVLKTEVVKLQTDKGRMDAELKTLDAELNHLTRESSARTQLDLFKKERTSKVDNVRKIKSKIEDSMKHLVGHMPTENLRRELDKVQSKNNRCLRGVTEQLQRLRNDKTKQDTQRTMLREQLNKREEELRGYEERLSNVSGSQNFDEGLEKIQADLKKSQEEKGHLKGVDYLYRKYKGTLRGDDPPCPLCHRPFDNTSEVDELIDEIQSKLNMVPDKLERVQDKIDINTRKVENMLLLKPVKSAMAELTSDTIPTLKQKIKAITEQMDKLSTDMDDKSEEVETLSADEETAKMIQTEVAMIDKIQAELKDLDRKIAQQSSNLSGGDSDRSIHDVQSERENMLDELELVNKNLDRKRQKISDQQDHLQRLNKLLNELRGEKLQIESDLQQRTQLEAKRIDLASNNDTLDREIKDSKEEMKPLQSSITKKEKYKQELQREREDEYDIGLVQISEVKEEHRKVQSHNTEIHNYVAKGRDKELERNLEAMDSLEKKADKLTEDQQRIANKIQQMKDDLSSQKVRERELMDCMTVRSKQCEMDDLEKRIAELEEKMGGVDTNNLHQEIRDLENRQGRLVTERHQAESRQMSFETEISRIKKELKHDMFRDAEAQYTEKMIAVRTTEIANQDLEKYYKALDRTIMTYHNQKMEEINKIIRELWRNTYKGNDIETIEICSDEEEGSGAAKTRRTYNYRVVMVKAGQRMDMRNRCSAGQKVLASLIIRLALAETFCLNCGILALDEPTTNLDRENIESLAYALVEIIKSRSRQRNFQLVIITHDEDFVELLGRSGYVEEFFKVRKSAEGHSQLVKAKVQDLHTR